MGSSKIGCRWDQLKARRVDGFALDDGEVVEGGFVDGKFGFECGVARDVAKSFGKSVPCGNGVECAEEEYAD